MLKNLRAKKNKKGFTLIELVIVLAVLAIIALIAIPNFTKVKENAVTKANEVNCDQVANITKLAVTEGVLKPDGATFTIKVTASDNTAGRIALAGTLNYGFKEDKTPYTEIDLQTRFIDIEAPQGNNGDDGYSVTISDTGRVVVKTSKIS
ncbi:MAG: competence type IV pilus major pilin ComGC [Sarcina sp.]